ncbi:cytochrome C biogenesis transmembrane region family protein [Mycobacterium kansasii]|uniref:Cytochrome C biogenesis transmembrane region family protein n=1 Tax=Mycobacterium kansasii TaxID=1768 RepID=A0A1V3XB31_MYCKA|nr:cytochrome C biogenesis transmembrane region family protein [Mycobacterium kansasii]
MIDTAPLGFALGAGLVAALNPCGFALLPGYLGLVIAGGSQTTSRPMALARAGSATLVMSAGFLTVFGVFGLLISPLIASVQKYLPVATVVIGVVLIASAIWLLAGKDIAVMTPKLAGGRRRHACARCTATVSPTRWPHCRAPSGRFWP